MTSTVVCAMLLQLVLFLGMNSSRATAFLIQGRPTPLLPIEEIARTRNQQSLTELSATATTTTTRRDVVVGGCISMFAPLIVVSPTKANAEPPKEAAPLPEKLSVEFSKERFKLARSDLKYLLDNYSEVSKGGGDAVRNYLGTQGVNRNMYGIQKVLKLLKEESEDIVEYTEALEEFNAYFYQAEGAAYQSNFAEFSSAKTTSAEKLATAKQDIVQMMKYMDQLAIQLNL